MTGRLTESDIRRSLPALRLDWRLFAQAAAIAWLVILWSLLNPDLRSDAHGYWLAAQPGVEPYSRGWSVTADAYVYPPPFLQLITPAARLLDWPTFHALWSALLMGCVVVAVGPLWAVVLLIPIRPWPVWEALVWGNVEIPMALALLAGAWPVLLLTKVTPVIGLLWHAVRREWRPLAVALGITAAIGLASFAMAPHLWFDWLELITTSTYQQPYAAPLLLRIALGGTLIALGAVTGRRWVMPIGIVVALPRISANALAIPMIWVVARSSARWR